MATWSSRGLRGSGLEELINKSNEKYRENHLGLVQKIPTPITPIKIDKESRHITLAYFEQKSTVDYVGVIQGVPVCFDAKECVTDTFSMQNIHEHQINFMREFEEQGGIAFIILQFTKRNEIYYIPLESLNKFYERAKNGGRKSFTYEEIDKNYIITTKSGVLVHYLPALKRDLENR
ncbi:MAG: Holliday junction resolvase RecU [Lachnospiraceae bacterium]|uniref:Holliday junction resolvase RecU n=1 Tax=Falcatimonas sp. MSJ-15 TaxID=2841515 RepID=UPI001C11AF62|nr:Holliday junction resolvase RecU [Falcatimonas sp. MSJ-15]MBQ5736044.1 Holliday junction resolvase RecU [Lachnospiraceae bacterium]MBU5470313.1 Holliday junction resolvase RecU [Falcatimonas sp. MSJ-15]